MQTFTVPVSGMSCRNCETLIESRLAAIERVESVDADVDERSVTVESPTEHEVRTTVEQAIVECGYAVRE